MRGDGGKVIWRVYARDGAPSASAFDALLLSTDGSAPDRLARPTQVLDASVPYEAELADTPFTLVVHARPDREPLIVECEGLSADGRPQFSGRASQPIAVIVRSATGVLVTGLPGGPPPAPAS